MQAKDHGEPPLNGTTTIQMLVNDANDHAPQFRFEGCLDTDLPTISMEEVIMVAVLQNTLLKLIKH